MSDTTVDHKAAQPIESAVLAQLAAWDKDWAQKAQAMSANPWQGQVLSPKFLSLVALAVSCACTNLNAPATQRWIRASLAAGASRQEVLMIAKMASVMAIHSCSLGAPILLEAAKAAGVTASPRPDVPTPFCDRMKEMGQWNAAWDPFYALDPQWTDQVMAAGAAIYASGVFTPKEMELLSIAFDASFTHMYAPGTARHTKAALAAGATVEEIFEVLKVCTALGMEALNLAVPLLAAELGEKGRR